MSASAFSQVVVIACIVAAAVCAIFGASGWGWFLFVAVLLA